MRNISSILFVCTGNICRSPTAHGIMEQMLRDANITHIKVDSAGTHGFHQGEMADPRAIVAAADRGYDLSHIISRPLNMQDFIDFDLLVAMDSGHLRFMQMKQPKDSEATIKLHSDFVENPAMIDVPDPYYGGQEHFYKAFGLIEQGCAGILNIIRKSN